MKLSDIEFRIYIKPDSSEMRVKFFIDSIKSSATIEELFNLQHRIKDTDVDIDKDFREIDFVGNYEEIIKQVEKIKELLKVTINEISNRQEVNVKKQGKLETLIKEKGFGKYKP